MDAVTFSLMAGAIATAVGSVIAAAKAAGSAYDTAVDKRAQQLHYQQLAEQSEKTIAMKDEALTTKDQIIAEKDLIIERERSAHDECRTENQRLWRLYNGGQ